MSKSEFAPIIDRVHRAHIDFAAMLMDRTGIDQDAANRVKNFYLKKKFAKMDAGIGRISVKHGAFLDKEVILRAVEASK